MRRETLLLRPLELAAPGTGDGSGAQGGQVPAQFPQGRAPDRTLRCGPSSPPCQLCLLCGRALRWLSPWLFPEHWHHASDTCEAQPSARP